MVDSAVVWQAKRRISASGDAPAVNRDVPAGITLVILQL